MSAGNDVRVGIVGCGQIGRKRAHTLRHGKLVACVDAMEERAQALANEVAGAEPYSDWRILIDRPDIQAVVVCTTHDLLAEITLAAIRAGKHVLVEKPAARRAAELDLLMSEADHAGAIVRVGFNHRYHRALRQARAIVDRGDIGDLMFVRGRYGHGGRVGYEREWRANPVVSGGGELIDQGVHLIDLARWFLGDFVDVHGFAQTYHWDMAVEDNGFLLLKTKQDRVAFLHASWTEWKNLFSFEIVGREGKIDIQGLGGSYGTERVALYRMFPEMGPPETTIWEYPMADDSWEVEFAEFADDIRLVRSPSVGLADARAALRIVEQVYETSAS